VTENYRAKTPSTQRKIFIYLSKAWRPLRLSARYSFFRSLLHPQNSKYLWLDLFNLPWVNILEWARLPGDALFSAGGALPVVWLCWQALRYPNRSGLLKVDARQQ